MKEKTDEIKLLSKNLQNIDVIKIENLVIDFNYIKNTLKENIDNGKRILDSFTYTLLDLNSVEKKLNHISQLYLVFAQTERVLALTNHNVIGSVGSNTSQSTKLMPG